jgi:ABC-type uncharacterized transport system auxiliary subunit
MRCRYLLVALSALLGLSACSLPGARTQAIQYFVLEAPALVPASVPPAAAGKADQPRPVLLLRDAEASVFTQNPRLIYSRSPGTRAYYQYALWTESPPKRLQSGWMPNWSSAAVRV